MALDDGESRPWTGLSERELQALHDVEVGSEWIQRAHGHLVGFHHSVGHGMDRLDVAERILRAEGHEALANTLRDDVLPRGVVDDAWSYGILEAYQEGLLEETLEFERRTCDVLADGERHVNERRQRRRRRDNVRD